MRILVTICLFTASVFSLNIQAQNKPLNKQQTLDYIESVYKQAYSYKDNKLTNISLDGNILKLSFNNGNNDNCNLFTPEPLKVGLKNNGYNVYFSEQIVILYCIQTETDAKRLKKALEHLIEILKTENNTDPFGE